MVILSLILLILGAVLSIPLLLWFGVILLIVSLLLEGLPSRPGRGRFW